MTAALSDVNSLGKAAKKYAFTKGSDDPLPPLFANIGTLYPLVGLKSIFCPGLLWSLATSQANWFPNLIICFECHLVGCKWRQVRRSGKGEKGS